MNTILLALIAGTLFGLGMVVSQMVNPDKVLAFLDVAGNWDPSLILVMVGALAVAALGFYWVRKRGRPLLDSRFYFTSKTRIDPPLLIGAALFGIGWGMAGYCPGPVVTSLALGNREALIMIASLYVGFLVADRFGRKG
ncbi:MAG: YeeE/YedE family protein [Methylomonas sp.]|nr:YeeE/YedE family protein [Methylomonas sp.]PPD21344.1 MAG: YeeE/YedE family protein [Methylomonas sp.]PPD26915.1 MAG: YeeE/YedE family protein [Methylomonas sp.]PPD38845.1 MAG: YeeE/YedE family protein [Methylomonas sp.]PPD41721.1 MAG: YeeE/YedE family protein [Methylomonas sp.]